MSDATLEGTWIPAAARVGDYEIPPDDLNPTRLLIEDSQYTAFVGKAIDRGTLTIHAEIQPAALDIIGLEGINAGKTFLTIFRLEGDELTICYALSGDRRPAAFQTDADDLYLVTYQRAAS